MPASRCEAAEDVDDDLCLGGGTAACRSSVMAQMRCSASMQRAVSWRRMTLSTVASVRSASTDETIV
jgi:hypothetical protein